MNICLLHRRTARRAGMSLIEVTMAIGIASFCMVTVMGLLPVGLSIMRDAVDQTVESQIVQQMHAEIQQTGFSRLGERYEARTYYFSEEGDPLESATGARYRAVTGVTAPVY